MKSPVASNKYYVSSTEIKSKLLQAEVCDLLNFRNIASSVKSKVLFTLSMLDACWICPRAYFEPSQTSKMQLSAITIFTKDLILDLRLGSKCASASIFSNHLIPIHPFYTL